jgi:hypothetical protein
LADREVKKVVIMETLLLVITLISVATAIVAMFSTHRLRRHERERSDARVAALSAAADTHESHDGGWSQISGEWRWNASASTPVIKDPEFGTAPQMVSDRGPGFGTAPASAADQNSTAFFGTVQREETSGSRVPIFAAAALIVLLGGALIFLNTSTTNDHAATVAHEGRTEPIELVALGHNRDVSTLTITGTVRNPSSGVKLEGLTAVISLLDRNGALVSTKDVPLDYRAIAPGEEAPFKVSIPDPGSIARYRVSFRAGTDVVPHVDRRVDTKLASAIQ